MNTLTKTIFSFLRLKYSPAHLILSVRYKGSDSLILLHVFFRHGHRYISKKHSYPNDPHKNLTFFPYGWSQLTNKGKLCEYNLGRFVRQRYDNYLGELYTPGLLESWATDRDRTQMSMQLFLAGLFPPKGELVWNKDLEWQPIPYKYVQRQDDNMFLAFHANRKYKEAYLEYQKSSGVKDKHKDLIEYMNKHTGMEIKHTKDIWRIYLNLSIQKELGLELPAWTKKLLPEPLKTLAETEYIMETATPKMRKLGVGPLMDKIIKDSKAKIEGKTTFKMYIYSVHEVNVAHLLIMLDSYELHIPHYGACVFLEVHKTGADSTIKGFYKAQEGPELTSLKICKLHACPLGKFVELIENKYK